MRSFFSIHELDVKGTESASVIKVYSEGCDGYRGFGEAYFSVLTKGYSRPFKRHKSMALNLVVMEGSFEFKFSLDLTTTVAQIFLADYTRRITVEPMIWFSFTGLSDRNVIMNLANIRHDENEIERDPS